VVPLLWALLSSYALAAAAAFWFMHKSRLLIGYHLGMNMAMTSGGILGISIGAVTAAVLAGAKADPIAALDRLWRKEFVVSPPRPIDRLVPPRIGRRLAALGRHCPHPPRSPRAG